MTSIAIAWHWLCGMVVLAEALNKLERSNPLEPGLTYRMRWAAALKPVAWLLMALGGGGAVVGPFLKLEPPSLVDVCVMTGFAVLIVRTRVKEG